MRSRSRAVLAALLVLALGGCDWVWTARANLRPDGSASTGHVGEVAVSASGAVVAFTSPDAGIVPAPVPPGAPGRVHLYLRDLATGQVQRISDVVPGYLRARSLQLTGTGSSVVFVADDAVLGRPVAYRYDRATGLLHELAPGLGDPRIPAVDRARVSEDGSRSLVEFRFADEGGANRVATFDAQSLPDLEELIGADVVVGLRGDGDAFYVRTLDRRLPVDTDSAPDVYRRSLVLEPDVLHDLALPGGATPRDQVVSADGTAIVTTGLDAGSGQVRAYRTDLTTGVTSLVSVLGGVPRAVTAVPAVSSDGDVVVFTDGAGVHVNHVRRGVQRSLAPVAAKDVAATVVGGLSGDGGHVALATATRLAADDTDAVRDAVVLSTLKPLVTGVAPGTLARASTGTVVLTGSGFTPGAQILLSGSGATASAVTVVSPNELRFTVSVAAGAPTGLRNVTVIQPAPGVGTYGSVGSAYWCRDCLRIG